MTRGPLILVLEPGVGSSCRKDLKEAEQALSEVRAPAERDRTTRATD